MSRAINIPSVEEEFAKLDKDKVKYTCVFKVDKDKVKYTCVFKVDKDKVKYNLCFKGVPNLIRTR